MPTTLIIDTSTSMGQLALFSDDKLIAEEHWGDDFTHSEVLTQKYLKLLAQAQIKTSDLQQIILSHGPGSFTGLRVGVNFAKTLAYTQNLPVFLSSSLRAELNLKTLKAYRNLLILRPALRNRYYVGQYFLDTSEQIVEKVLPETLSQKQIISEPYFAKSLYVQVPNYLDIPQLWLDHYGEKVFQSEEFKKPVFCQNILHLFKKHYDSLNFEKCNWKTAYPLYIRASEAEEKMKVGELKIHTKRKL